MASSGHASALQVLARTQPARSPVTDLVAILRRSRCAAATRHHPHGSHHAAVQMLSDVAVKREHANDARIPEVHAQRHARVGSKATPGGTSTVSSKSGSATGCSERTTTRKCGPQARASGERHRPTYAQRPTRAFETGDCWGCAMRVLEIPALTARAGLQRSSFSRPRRRPAVHAVNGGHSWPPSIRCPMFAAGAPFALYSRHLRPAIAG